MNEASGEVLSFSNRVLRFLERVEHRVATNPSDREAAFRLRCQAYRSIGDKIGFQRPSLDRLYDPLFDDDPYGWTTMTFLDGELAGTVRINVGFGDRAVLPGLKVFGDLLTPKLLAGQVIVEFTRLAARLELSSVYPQLAYLIMRPAYMAAAHVHADYAVASPRAEHVAFYQRAFGAKIWCAPRDYPGLTARFACLGSDLRVARARIESRYPFYKSTAAEREALFGRPGGRPIASETAAAPTRRETKLSSVAKLSACA